MIKPSPTTAILPASCSGRARWSEVAEEIDRLGCKRALVLSTPFQKRGRRAALAAGLGELSPGSLRTRPCIRRSR